MYRRFYCKLPKRDYFYAGVWPNDAEAIVAPDGEGHFNNLISICNLI